MCYCADIYPLYIHMCTHNIFYSFLGGGLKLTMRWEYRSVTWYISRSTRCNIQWEAAQADGSASSHSVWLLHTVTIIVLSTPLTVNSEVGPLPVRLLFCLLVRPCSFSAPQRLELRQWKLANTRKFHWDQLRFCFLVNMLPLWFFLGLVGTHIVSVVLSKCSSSSTFLMGRYLYFFNYEQHTQWVYQKLFQTIIENRSLDLQNLHFL